jgi:hypothetical protein
MNLLGACALVFMMPVAVMLASDDVFKQDNHLALYVNKDAMSGHVVYRLNNQIGTLEAMLMNLRRVLKHDDGQLLEVIVADTIQMKELTCVLRELGKAGWNKVRLNGLLDGQLTSLAWRGEILLPVDSKSPVRHLVAPQITNEMTR